MQTVVLISGAYWGGGREVSVTLPHNLKKEEKKRNRQKFSSDWE